MKVLSIVDKSGSAIDRCCWAIRDNCDWFEYKILPYHPKRADNKQIDDFITEAQDADILSFEYWKTAEKIRQSHPEIFNSKKKILTHYNPYNLNDIDNSLFDRVVVRNNYQKKHINHESILIPYTIDMNLFQYKREFQIRETNDSNFTVLMVASRIESTKGILSVVKAVKQLGIQMILVGRISKKEYFSQIMSEGAGHIEPRLNITEDELVKAYHDSDLLIVNSDENFESGPLPILEAISSGTPVLAREIGLVPDVYDENMFLRSGFPEDIDSIVKDIQHVRENQKQMQIYRDKAFFSILDRDNRYTARRYYQLFCDVLHEEKPLVSVIIPTHNRIESFVKSLISIQMQSYKNIEIVVVDDGSDEPVKKAIKAVCDELRAVSKMPLKFISSERFGYGLARARNIGAQEADGQYLLFLDDRLTLERDAVQSFLEHYSDSDRTNLWIFGDKGSQKTNFVENFSFISKSSFVRGGMFCERITQYGAITAETFKRYRGLDYEFEYCPSAKSVPVLNSKSRFTKKQDIINSKFQLWQLWETKKIV